MLRRLQGTQSLREIAAELYVSQNTIKTFTLSLYRKLGVHSRSEAVAHSTDQGEPILHQGSRDKAAKALLQLVDRFDPAWEAKPRRGLHRRAAL